MPRPCKLTFDLLTLKVVSESRVTWATSVPILVFLGLSVLDLGPMDVRHASSLNAPYPRGGGITTEIELKMSLLSNTDYYLCQGILLLHVVRRLVHSFIMFVA